MKKVKFALNINENNEIIYPDNIELFSKTSLLEENNVIIADMMMGYYSGDLPLEEIIEPIFPIVFIPTITINTITTDNVNSIIENNFDITIPLNTTININGRLESNLNQNIIPVTKSFRLPIKASDGRELVTLLSLVNGEFNHSFKFEQSGVWFINSSSINSRLPREEHMSFNGLEIFVIQ
jgi:hypothetical protein